MVKCNLIHQGEDRESNNYNQILNGIQFTKHFIEFALMKLETTKLFGAEQSKRDLSTANLRPARALLITKPFRRLPLTRYIKKNTGVGL